MGHIITDVGVLADPKKVDCVEMWPIPKNVKELRGFLGLTGYYRRFVRNYGKIAQPLTQLLKIDGFKWDERAQVAFEALRKAVTIVPALALPDFKKVFLVEADASGFCFGVVLMQEGRPIAFWSQTLEPRAASKSVYEKELMAVGLAVQKWRHYLLGRHFKVKSDQKNLKYLFEQKVLGSDQQRWVIKLIEFDFEIVYKPWVENKVADALSRRGNVLMSLNNLLQFGQKGIK